MKAFVEFLLSLAVIFVNIMLAIVLGGILGWFVGIFFGDTILGICAALGIKGFSC